MCQFVGTSLHPNRMPSRITQQSYRPRVSNRIMGWQLSFSQRFELAQLRELTASNAHRVMKQAWDQLELDSSLCGAHKVNSKPIVDRNGAWMQSAKLPHLARGGENISLDIPFYRISLDIPFYRIPLSQVPRRKNTLLDRDASRRCTCR